MKANPTSTKHLNTFNQIPYSIHPKDPSVYIIQPYTEITHLSTREKKTGY